MVAFGCTQICASSDALLFRFSRLEPDQGLARFAFVVAEEGQAWESVGPWLGCQGGAGTQIWSPGSHSWTFVFCRVLLYASDETRLMAQANGTCCFSFI